MPEICRFFGIIIRISMRNIREAKRFLTLMATS
jgi:hypothetical protein